MVEKTASHSRNESREVKVPVFSHLLGEITFAPNRAISDEIKEINLGTLCNVLDGLINETRNDPERREYGRNVIILPDGRAALENKRIQGYGHNIKAHLATDIRLGSVSKRLRQDKFWGCVPHSHPIDVPPSPQDIAPLLLSDLDFAALTSVLIVTPKRRIAIFRSATTPGLEEANLEPIVSRWLEEIYLTIDTIMNSNWAFDPIAVNIRVQDDKLKEEVLRYNLKYFECSTSEHILKLK